MLPAPLNQLTKNQTKILSYHKGQAIFRQGDKTRGLFYIEDGTVELRRHSPSGEVILIHTAKDKDTFAEASLFSTSYHCDAKASTKATIIEVKKSSVLKLFNQDPAFALELTKRFAKQIQTYRRKIELLAIHNASERVYAAVNEGLLSSDIKSFASEINLSHEAVYRALAQLVRQGRLHKIARGQFEPANRSNEQQAALLKPS